MTRFHLPCLPLVPADLSQFGLTGCRLEVSADATLLLLLAAGTATNTIPLPNTPSLTDLPLFSQALVLDSLASNGVGGTSRAVHAVLGQ
ncbi:MAG: hypothetical protein FJ265_06705 [Planctomycetes bacterium]|nr:hypothetical protein [Planctomycetota bacterium]